MSDRVAYYGQVVDLYGRFKGLHCWEGDTHKLMMDKGEGWTVTSLSTDGLLTFRVYGQDLLLNTSAPPNSDGSEDCERNYARHIRADKRDQSECMGQVLIPWNYGLSTSGLPSPLCCCL